MFWLPPNGFGNGVAATNWAELADLPERELAGVLFALAEAGIGGYVAVPHISAAKRFQRTDPETYRLWVDSLRYRHAEDILMRVLAELHGKHPPTPHGEH